MYELYATKSSICHTKRGNLFQIKYLRFQFGFSVFKVEEMSSTMAAEVMFSLAYNNKIGSRLSIDMDLLNF